MTLQHSLLSHLCFWASAFLLLTTPFTTSALQHGFVYPQNQPEPLVVDIDELSPHHLVRRDVSNSTTGQLLDHNDVKNQTLSSPTLNTTDSLKNASISSDVVLDSSMISLVHLNDTHEQLTVHWAGKNSPVIICLAKNRKNSRRNQSSSVFISHNYGTSFERINTMILKNGSQAIISVFYISPVLNSFCIFVDTTNNYLFITKDFGKNFQRVELAFKPKVLQMHHTIPNMILAQSINHPHNDSSLYMSENFGLSWNRIQDKIAFFSWSIEGVDLGKNLKKIFVLRREPSGSQSLLSSDDLFRNMTTLLTEVAEVQIHGRFIFATRRLHLFGAHERDFQLWISIDRKEFVRASIPTHSRPIEYHVADVTSDIIFLCATFQDGTTNLYSSYSNFEDFTLSIENILYFNSKITKNLPGLNYDAIGEQEFADLHRITGIRGSYIVSKWKNSTKRSVSDITSLITYDMGNKWHQLKAPSVDSFGRNFTCSQHPHETNTQCSLHLVQKYHSLSTNVKTILTRESSVGFVLATGVVGSSLKGKQSIYLSLDAGNTWRQILSGNYLYAIGDFGAIIVAVAHYSKGGLTNELYYSIDDGESFQVMKFSNEKIRVYSLFTEPGEKTTVFTIFGSKENPHDWIVIQANFTSLFKAQCQMPVDYKEWSPHDFESDCLLGSTQIFQRRIAAHKCFNGESFMRPTAKINCPCKHADYECDIGFVRGNHTHSLKCVKDENSQFDLDAIPSSCSSGKMFNKTKGYRRINGDTCEGGEEDWYSPQMLPCPFDSSVGEFILFVQRQDISMISLDADNFTKSSLVPKNFISNAIAADFDIKKNCLFWSDITLNRILRLCLDGRQSQPEVLVENELYSVEGIVFNQINRHLYFVNGFKSKVELIDVDSVQEGKMRRTIISKPLIDKPRGIAIDPVEGYLFITDWSTSTPAIIRSDLDGEGFKILFNSDTVTWPNGITVDHHRSQVLWVDAKHDYIAMSNYEGKNLRYVVKSEQQAPHPFALAVFKNEIFYDDWNLHKLIVVNKHNSSAQKVILNDVNGGMDLKIITPFFSEHSNACALNGTCSHLCVVKPFNDYRCLCPDGFNISKDAGGHEKCDCAQHQELSKTGICRTSSTNVTCQSNEFTCANGNCISRFWKCDGDSDCEDNSDELQCLANECKSTEFQCVSNGKCVLDLWMCDHQKECEDGSDEDIKLCAVYFPTCNRTHEFQCTNYRCISKSQVCDHIDDCHDGSDELLCRYHSTSENVTCEKNHFQCANGDCIPRSWQCDSFDDCPDNSDEVNCANFKCPEGTFLCNDDVCIDQNWVCDRERDCVNGADERNCTYSNSTIVVPTPLPGDTNDFYRDGHCPDKDWLPCQNGHCIPLDWHCDRNKDCKDGSDEEGCYDMGGLHVNITNSDTNNIKTDACGMNKFYCYRSNQCIDSSYFCDGDLDCSRGEDELYCRNEFKYDCPLDEFTCSLSFGCVSQKQVCNGKRDCPDGSDEWGCEKKTSSTANTTTTSATCHGFVCTSGECVPQSARCDGKPDCFDVTDEDNCDLKGFAVEDLHVIYDSIKTNSFTIVWRSPNTSIEFAYLPGLAHYDDDAQRVNASWTSTEKYTFTGLSSGTRYKVFVHTKLLSHDGQKIFAPNNFIKVTTAFVVPDAPSNFVATEIGFNKVQIEWSTPSNMTETIVGYKIYHSPPYPAASRMIEARQSSSMASRRRQFTVGSALEVGVNYTFWMTTLTKSLESAESNKMFLKISPITTIVDLHSKLVTNSSVQLEWRSEPVSRVSKWFITYRCEQYFASFVGNFTTSRTNVQISNLSPGVNYQFRIFPIVNNTILYDGIRENSIELKTLGEQLPSITVDTKVRGSLVSLGWSPPTSYNGLTNIDWEYAVYVGSKLADLKPYARTRDTKLVLQNLFACELYIVQIRVVAPFGFGPSANDYKVKTIFDASAPPKSVKVEPLNGERTKYRISWNASCSNVDRALGYRVSVNDVVYGREDGFKLQPNTNFYQSMDLWIHYGADYQIRVSTDHPEARWSETVHLKPPSMPRIARPKAYMNKQGKIFIVWKTVDNYPKDEDHLLRYKVFIGTDNDKLLTKGESFLAHEPPVIHQPSKPGAVLYIAVALIDNHGYVGPLSESFLLQKDDMVVSPIFDPTTSSPSSSSGVTLLYCLVFVLVLAIILLPITYYFGHNSPWHLIGRPSVLVNSHYNSRLDSATLSPYDNSYDASVDEDLPVFADDEPLVNT